MKPRETRRPSGPVLPFARRGALIAALGLGCCVLAGRQTVLQRPVLPTLTRSEGLVALDYEVIPVKGGASIDLMGFHYLKPLNGWLYVGVGGHAPLVKGDYGGFMAFDATVHAQWPLAGNLFLEG
ncbi:MAG TPA: hypothetical protein VFT46_01625, partial [Holophagaceae bacterium]|nr:hypothetical protein [Holophagaceae bacterium]